MIRQQHHLRVNGHEFEQTLGDKEEQGSLVCYSSWGHKELDMTQQLNNNSLDVIFVVHRSAASISKQEWGISVHTTEILNQDLLFLFLSFFFFFLFGHAKRLMGILVLQPGIELRPLTVKAPSPDYWTARKFPRICILYGSRIIYMSIKFEKH